MTVKLTFKPVSTVSSDCIAEVKLDRPDAANAFNAEMIAELTEAFSQVGKETHCRAAVLCGSGRHFSAGADLNWMKSSSDLTYEENIADAEKLSAMFEALCTVPVPTVAVVQGATFGGAVGLVACCDWAIAHENAKFCLSEVRLGILPAVILPYLARKMAPGQLRRLSLSARVFSGEDAKQYQLVERTSSTENWDNVIRDEMAPLLQASPSGQQSLKKLQRELFRNGYQQSEVTCKAIATARTGKDGQEGFRAYFAKEKPPWQLALPDEWKL